MENSLHTSITGLILAGGRAMRMNNVDKGLQDWHGKSLVAHAASKLSSQVSTVIINANRHLDVYAQLGFPVFSDTEPDYKGPVAGLEVGLRHCNTPYLITVPCDSPFFPSNLAERLMEALQEQQADIAVVCIGQPAHPRDQPVFCLLKKSLVGQVKAYLDNGGRKMDGWYGQARVAHVYFEDAGQFVNFNTPEELRASLKSD